MLTHLAGVYHLLQGTSCDQTIHCDVTALTNSESPVLRLQVVAGVPAGVNDDHPAGPSTLSMQNSGIATHQTFHKGRERDVRVARLTTRHIQ